MSLKSTTNGLVLLVALAIGGAVLIVIPSWIASQIETVSSIGPAWLVYVYVAVVGSGARHPAGLHRHHPVEALAEDT